MSSLDIQFPRKIFFGPDSLNKISELVKLYGSRVLIVSEATVHDNPYLNQLKAILDRADIQVLVFDELKLQSSSDLVHSLINLAKVSKPSCIIALGGMNALSIARIVAILAGGKVSFERYVKGNMPDGASLPLISIPSSCKDHFMAQEQFIITDQYLQRPVVLHTPPSMERYEILDPRIGTGVSQKNYSMTMMDVLLAAVESYLSSSSNFLSEGQSLGAVERIAQVSLDFAGNSNDIRPRIKASEAGLLSALALSSSDQGLGGALSYAANSRFAVPKSWIATALLPYILDLHLSHQVNKVARLATVLGEDTDSMSPEDAASKASKSVRRLISRLGIPNRLRDFNLTTDMLSEIADIALTLDFVRFVPFTVTNQLLFDLLKQAY